MYDNCRLQLIYPGYEFRAGINYKNIEKGKPWAEGSLFCDGELNYYIVEKKEDTSCYRMHYIYPDFIWTDTYYRSGAGHDIFEGDIIKLTAFRQNEDPDSISGEKKEENSTASEFNDCPHPTYTIPPLSATTLWTVSGVVTFYGGVACLYYYDSDNNCCAAAPLYSYFESTGYPPENMAAEVLGNIVENPEIADKIFRINTF